MGVLDFFKKKEEPKYDATNIKVTDIALGFVFDYDLSSWIVEEVYEYDWGDNNFTQEFKIHDGVQTLYLSVEADDELKVSISKKVKIRAIDEDLPEYIKEHKKAPKKLNYEGATYYFEEECPGFFKKKTDSEESWAEFIAWDYEDENGNILCIEQWSETGFEASAGKVIKTFEISNILPK